MKTLDDAIGCWTVNPDYNSLVPMATYLAQSARRCRTLTKGGDSGGLADELTVLEKRTRTMLDLVKDAQRRLKEIIDTKELEQII